MTNKEALVKLEIMATNLIGDIQKGNELAIMYSEALDLASEDGLEELGMYDNTGNRS